MSLLVTALLGLAHGARLDAADLITIGPVQASAQAVGTGEVPLAELRWGVFAPRDPWGTAVEFSCGPFIHTEYPQHQADCRLSLRLLQAAPNAGWQVLTAGDQTRLTGRDTSASVAAGSLNPGSAVLGLQATFIPRSNTPLCAGEYVTQVVGLVRGM